MHAQGKQHTLQAILNGELQCTEQLLACLDVERNALAGRDTEILERTTAEKLQLSRQLEELDRQRAGVVNAMGFGNDTEALHACFNSLPQASVFNRLWRQILANLETCRTGNLTNGGILEASRQHVEQALGILRGQTAAPALYSQAGDTSTDFGRRDLGKV